MIRNACCIQKDADASRRQDIKKYNSSARIPKNRFQKT